MSVNDQILDAIELLAKSSVERAGYDKTIQAQIVSCQDKEAGKYKCKYQDATFYAYTNNSNMILSKGTMVYILVPQNNMSKNKTIIGTVEKLGVDYITITQGEDAYEKVGANVITMNNDDVLYLDTNQDNYNYSLNNSDYLIDMEGFLKYFSQSQFLIVAATIQTKNPLNQTGPGNYGINFRVKYNEMNDDYLYTLNINNMIGDPYALLSPTRQVAIFPIINKQNFSRFKGINIFSGGFGGNATTQGKLSNGDIIISNLEVYCANRLSQQQLNGVRISLYTPDGTFFHSGQDSTIKRIIAKIKVKGQEVSVDGIPFYWGLEDMSVTSYSPKFNQYLGYGWQHLTTSSQIGWNPESNFLILRQSDISCFKNTYKVAVIYDGNLITQQIDIQNLNGEQIEITSSEGIEFFNNIGRPNLICSKEIGIHYWGWSNNGGYYQQADQIIGNANGKTLQQIQIAKIINFANFKCTVYNEGLLVGTGSIKLTNEENDKANYLTLINGDAVFKYSSNGTAPTSKAFQNPQLIKELTFIFRDSKTGVEIYNGSRDTGSVNLNTIFTDPNCVIWRIPIENTLIEDKNNITPIQENGSYSQYYDSHYNSYINTGTISYDIAKTYNYNKTNNQIKLQVHYNDIIVYTQTQFTFTKQGDVGTNGTEYTVRLVSNISSSTPLQYPIVVNANGIYKIIYKNNNSQYDQIFFGSYQKLFKAELYKSGELLWEQGDIVTKDGSEAPTISWRILSNKYQNNVYDDSDFEIYNNDPTTGQFAIKNGGINSNEFLSPKANIIECKILYNEKLYYSTVPIITAWVNDSNNRFLLKQGTGFKYVIYSADGVSPQYDNTNPFEIIWNNNTSTSSGYTFNVVGGIKTKSDIDSSWSYNSNPQLFAISEQENQNDNKKAFRPIDKYDGQQVTNAVVCIYGSTAKIRIPIHFMLNRFGQSNINAWDGNSVQIDSNGGFILAPQIGAGVKDNNNRFTGVVMGKVREAGKNNYNIGLFGYASGARSFFLNSDNGSAIFGESSGGQIIVDPSSTKALLYSSNFWSSYNTTSGLPSSYNSSNESGNGMLIDLSTPSIRYGNKNFMVASDGQTEIGQYNFVVDNSGNVFAGVANPNYSVLSREGWFGSNHTYANTYDKYNFSIDSSTGNITIKGAITATSGYIGSGTNKWKIGSDSTNAWIYSKQRSQYSYQSQSALTKGLYFGTDGISVGDGSKVTFSIDSNGNVSLDGNITLGANSTINWNTVSQSGGTATLNSDFSDPTTSAGIVAQNANDAASDASDALTAAGNAVDNVAALANGNYANGTFIDKKKIISPTIIADSFYAQPETLSAYQSGHFILQSPYSISGGTAYFTNVLDITYGYDSFRPYVGFTTTSYNGNYGYFKFVGGEVQFYDGMQLPSTKKFLNYGTIKNHNVIEMAESSSKLILKSFNTYFWAYSGSNSLTSTWTSSNAEVGQLCFIIDS